MAAEPPKFALPAEGGGPPSSLPPLPGLRRAERAGGRAGAGRTGRDEEAGREGGAAGGHERGQDLPAAPLHGEALPGDGQHGRRRLLPQAVGALQHLHLGHGG